ncbi:MAG TPA: methyl-accepting chemotaxis protein [Burkholderiaceae bacterium]
MKLKTKLSLTVALCFGLFLLALSAALVATFSAKDRFETFVNQDQAELQMATTMYAQGLQMGQALRNVVMDPANRTAYKNLDDAAAEFARQQALASTLLAQQPKQLAIFTEIAEIRRKQQPIQAHIVSLASTDQAGAIAAIASDETPVWRQMRERLVKFAKAKNEAVAVTRAEMEAFTTKMVSISVALAVLALVTGVWLMWWLISNVMKQLGGEPDYAARIAHGIAAGDFSQAVELQRKDSDSLLFSMDAMRVRLSQTLQDVQTAAHNVSSGAREIALGNADLSARTEDQAASLEETASSMEEMTSTVHQNAENAQQARQLGKSAAEIATQGGAVVGRVVETMASIKDGSRKIVEIISVIDGIAFQTNILALNAAVEAARAGEQGRGFAVVAGEVRTLAQRSAAAAKEIKELIGDSVNRVDAGSLLVDEAGATMEEVVSSVQRVTNILDEIAAASQEQSSGIEQINLAITQMDEVTQQNAALVEEAAAAAQSMQDQAERLAATVAQFKLASVEGAPASRLAAPAKRLSLPA